MTPKQFRTALDRLGISQVGLARLLKMGPRSARRWASGEAAVPTAVEALLVLLTAERISMLDIECALDRTKGD